MEKTEQQTLSANGHLASEIVCVVLCPDPTP